MLVSSVEQSDQLYIYMYLFFFKFFSHLGYYRVLHRVPYAIHIGPCWSSTLNKQVNLKLPIYPSPGLILFEST